jgi:hypothetical protein
MRRPRTKPPSPTPDPARAIRRRRFLRLLAAGSAAVVAGVASPAAAPAQAPTKSRPRRGKPARPAAVERELEKQRKSVADMLRVIRDYELAPGSSPAIAFRPIRARREGR